MCISVLNKISSLPERGKHETESPLSTIYNIYSLYLHIQSIHYLYLPHPPVNKRDNKIEQAWNEF